MRDSRPSSYSFQHRGELPSYDAQFTRDAGLSREAFEELRTGRTPEPRITPDASERDQWYVKLNLFDLPEPRPDFAPPNRARFNADWEEMRRLSRAKFEERRLNMASRFFRRARDR